MKITKAIIPAAGFGTRFLPVTKTVQKEMLPLLTRPTIDYVVEDCVNAGITDIIFIVKEGDTQIRHYYSEDLTLKRYLERMKKADKYELVADLHTKANFHFVEQKESDPYGTAVPVILAKDHVINEDAFLVLMGDDLFYNADGTNEVARMIEYFEKSGAQGMVTCLDVPKRFVVKYGIAEYREENGFKYLTNQIEKPEPDQVTSTLATISKYIYTPKIYKYFEGQQLDPKSGELYLTDTYKKLAKDEKMVLYPPKGEYLDSGYLWGWLKANLVLARKDEVLWGEILNFVETEIKNGK